MGGVIYTKIKRPPEEIIKEFEKISGFTPAVSDAMAGTRYMSSRIKPISTAKRICGPAITVNNPAGSSLLLHKATEIAQPGDVIVGDCRGYTDDAVWGYLMTLSAINKRIAGVVIDGSARDINGIRETDFPVFAVGVVGRGPNKATWGGEINTPIQCGGVPVDPGDVILGNEDGVVVIPRKECKDVLLRAKEIIAREKMEERRRKSGILTFEKWEAVTKKLLEAGFQIIEGAYDS